LTGHVVSKVSKGVVCNDILKFVCLYAGFLDTSCSFEWHHGKHRAFACMYGVWVPKRPHWVWHATFFRCMPTGWWQDWFEIWNVQLYLQYMICIVLKVNILIYFAIMITWLHIPNLQHAADTAKTESNVHVIFKITSLQFRCLKISQAVDCHIGSFASSGSYLASFDGSQNRWFLAMVRNCAGLKSLKTYREELDLPSLNLIWMSLKSLPFWWGNLRVFGSERTLAAWRFHPPKPTAHSDSNSQQKKRLGRGQDRQHLLLNPFKSLQDSCFISSKSQHPQENQCLLGFPQIAGPPDLKMLIGWHVDFLKKVRPCCIPLATLDLYLLGFGAPRQILKTLGWWNIQGFVEVSAMFFQDFLHTYMPPLNYRL